MLPCGKGSSDTSAIEVVYLAMVAANTDDKYELAEVAYRVLLGLMERVSA